ncbi:lipoprotein [Burkholderia pseudomallei]|nr:lipoprotein [Burkholderia pseudomallei]CAJ9490005.1 lipoprotein [Burkholderia pseudomallei]CAJ9525712.1 lipoprotein [Burkholderia pseudomallei]CFD91188.1 lipoprotein [Burkholderia pseudomallei]CFK67448.1 lipoprotein [Burkholderia pseudomallei]
MSFGQSKHRSRFSGASFKGNEKVKMSHTKGFAKLASVVAVGAALTACGGGGGSGTSTTTAITNTQLTGKAIDGYLAGATVCFDNGHGACDPSLPSTTTDASGNYTLNVSGNVTGKQLDVLITSNTTDGSSKFTSTFTMSAIVSGSTQNVTPLTTMVVAQMKSGKSQADAITAVKDLVGSGVDPNADYVGNGDTSTATTAASMVSHMTALAGQGPISWSQVQATMNAYAAKGSVIGVQQSDVDAQLTNPAYSSPVDATTALASPLYTVDGDLSQFIVGSSISAALSPVRENFTLSGSTLSVTQEVQSNGAWSPASPAGSYDAGFSGSWVSNDAGVGAYAMKADGTWTSWLTAAQLHPSYSLSTVGSTLVGTDPNTGDALTVAYRMIDVSGQPLSSALQIDYRNPVRGAMTGTFPSGTTAYLATTAYANDRLILVNQGFGMPWINGADVNSSTIVNGSILYALGDPSTTYTAVQQAVGTQTDIAGGCLLLSIQAGGVAQVVQSGKSGCNYGNVPLSFPVTGNWSVYSRNANVITIGLPKSVGAPTVPIDDDIKNVINAGGSLVVGLMNGKLMGGYMLPASHPQTVAQFPAATTDTIAASMRAAAASLGIQQNP